jgi:hypothetical protein
MAMFDDSERAGEIATVDLRRLENGREITVPKRWEWGDEPTLDWETVHGLYGGGAYVAIGRAVTGQIVARDAATLPGTPRPLAPEPAAPTPAPIQTQAQAPALDMAPLMQFMAGLIQQSHQAQLAASERADRAQQAFAAATAEAARLASEQQARFFEAMTAAAARQRDAAPDPMAIFRSGVEFAKEHLTVEGDDDLEGTIGAISDGLDSALKLKQLAREEKE